MPTKIHPTAVIEDGAQIGENCEIGAYAVIGGNAQLGDGTLVHPHVIVHGHTEVGEDCEIYSFACIGGQTQDLKYKGGTAFVNIGKGTTLREYVTVNCGTDEGEYTYVGENCHILAYCHIAHGCRVGNNVIISNGTQLGGHVIVEDSAVFGGLAGVHQFVRIGKMAMVAACAKATQDVAPFSIVEGVPGSMAAINKVALQRNGRSSETIRIISRAYRTLFYSNLTLDKAIQEVRGKYGEVSEIQNLLTFIENSERGITRPRKRKDSFVQFLHKENYND